MTTLNFVPTLLKMLSHLATSYYTLSPIFNGNLISVTTLNLVPRLLNMFAGLVTPYHTLSLKEKQSQDNFKFSKQTALKVIKKCGVVL